jgi:subtilisin family serine protease
MSRYWVLFLLFAVGAFSGGCSGGGSTGPEGAEGTADTGDQPIPGTPLPGTPQSEPTSVLVMIDGDELSEEEEDDEADEIRSELSGLNITRIGTTSFYVLDLPANVDPQDVLDTLDDDLRVVQAELNYHASAPEGGPDDLPTLGSDLLSSVRTQPRLAEFQLDAAHALSTGAGVIVAVVDTGVDFSHPLLAGSIASGGFDFVARDLDPSDERDFVDNDNDGTVDEQYGHGTFIASLVLAIAPDAQILPVRVLDAEGFGNASTVGAGIVWAADAGAQIINVSIEMATDSEAVKEAISYARDRGATVVAAAGNGGNSDIGFPARFSDVLAVTSLGVGDVVAPFANTGSQIDLAAPGMDLIGAVPMDLNLAGTARWSGTSFSVPLVAGSAALVLALDPALEATAVGEQLRETARPIDDQNPALAGKLGDGFVQVLAALQAR